MWILGISKHHIRNTGAQKFIPHTNSLKAMQDQITKSGTKPKRTKRALPNVILIYYEVNNVQASWRSGCLSLQQRTACQRISKLLILK
jgi:hypothetical protein